MQEEAESSIDSPIECIGIFVFCIRDYISRIRIRSVSMNFLEISNCTADYRGDEIFVHNIIRKNIISELEKSFL